MVLVEELDDSSDDDLPPLRPPVAKPHVAAKGACGSDHLPQRADGIPPVKVVRGIAAALAKRPAAAKAAGGACGEDTAARLNGSARTKAATNKTAASVDPGIDSDEGSDDSLPPLMSNPKAQEKRLQNGCEETKASQSHSTSNVGARPGPLDHAISMQASRTQDHGATLLALAETQLAADELEEALISATEARLVLRKEGNELMGAAALRMIIKVHIISERLDDAFSTANEELEIFQMSNSPQEEAMALLCVADVHLAKEQPNEALAVAEQALSLLCEVGDKKGQAAALQVKMLCYSATARHQKALEFGNESLALFRTVGDTHGYIEQLLELPKVHLALGDTAESLQTAQKACALYKRVGNKKKEAIALIAAAQAHLVNECAAEALQAAQQAVALCGEGRLAGIAWRVSGMAQLMQGSRNDAANHGQQALAIARKFNDRAEIGLALDHLVRIHTKSPGRAMKELDDEIQQAKRSRDLRREAQATHKLAILLRDDKPKEALLKAGEALKLLKRAHGNSKAEAEILYTIAEMYFAARNYEEALKVSEQAEKLLREFGDTRGAVHMLQLVTSLHLEMQDPEKALQSSFEQRRVYQEAGYKDEEVSALLGVADMLKELKGPTQAMKCVKEARLLYQAMENPKEESQTLITLANYQLQNQLPAEALRSAKEALALCVGVGYRAGQASSLEVIAHIHLSTSNMAEATKIVDDMLKVCQDSGNDDDRAHAACLQMTSEVQLQVANANQGRPTGAKFIRGALKCAKDALQIWRKISDKPGIALTLQHVTQAHLLSGNDQEALTTSTEASKLCLERQDSQGMATCALLTAQANLKTDAQAAMQQARDSADIFQQLGDSASHDNAMAVFQMAQESLQAQRSTGRINPRMGSSPATGSNPTSRSNPAVSRTSAMGSDSAIKPAAGTARGPSPSIPKEGQVPSTSSARSPRASSPGSGRGSAHNGTRRGGLGFNSFGRDPFQLNGHGSV